MFKPNISHSQAKHCSSRQPGNNKITISIIRQIYYQHLCKSYKWQNGRFKKTVIFSLYLFPNYNNLNVMCMINKKNITYLLKQLSFGYNSNTVHYCWDLPPLFQTAQQWQNQNQNNLYTERNTNLILDASPLPLQKKKKR